jgi:hypothetical protein
LLADNDHTAFLGADLAQPEQVLAHPTVRRMLDFDEPIALLLSAILHFIPDDQGPEDIVRTFVGALPPGSYVLATHVTPEHEPRLRPASAGYRDDGVRTRPRTAAEFERLVFTGLDLVEPGVVLVSQWRRDPDDPPAPSPAEVSAYGGLAAVPGA